MTEPNKHRHTAPKRAARPQRPARGNRVKPAGSSEAPQVPAGPLSADAATQLRAAVSGGSRAKPSRGGPKRPVLPGWVKSWPALIVFAVVVLGVAVVLRFVATGDDKAPKAAEHGPGAANASYGNQWTAADGSVYEISVRTLSDLVSAGSASSCIPVPAAGRTNLHFTVTIKNTSKKPEPVPQVLFATNLNRAGGVAKSVLTYPRGNKHVEITPLADALTCADGAKLGPGHRVEIPAGQSTTFTGTFGPTTLPVPSGVTVLVRYFGKDASAPSGQKATDLLAPFGTISSS